MRKTTILAIIIGIVWSCGSDTPESSKGLSSGSKIYALYCTQCHGSNGSLQLNGASNFLTSKLTLEERVDVIANGRKTMLPYKDQLTPAQIKAVATFTMNFNNGSK